MKLMTYLLLCGVLVVSVACSETETYESTSPSSTKKFAADDAPNGFDKKTDDDSDKKADAGADEKADAGADKKAGAGADEKADAGADKKADTAADKKADTAADKKADAGADKKADAGADKKADAGTDKNADAEPDQKADAGADNKADVPSLAEIAKEIEAGNAVLLDVREQKEWDEKHFSTAVLIPMSKLADDANLENLDKEKKIYTHCARGVRASRAADSLKTKGYNIEALKFSFDELEKNGFKRAEK